MATPRKHWFRVADSLLREPMTRRARSTFLGLLAWFNQRRARDGYLGRRAQQASIPPGDLLTITLSDSLEEARECIEEIRERFELSVETRERFTVIEWRNLARFQEWERPPAARRSSATRPPIARELPLPTPTPTPTPTQNQNQKREEPPDKPAAVPPPARSRSRRIQQPETQPPADLTDEQKQALRDWVAGEIRRGVLPASFHDKASLRRMVASCLDYFRAKGTGKADWPATVRNWIRREANGASPRGAREMPQMPHDGRGSDPTPIGNAASILKIAGIV